MGLNLNIDTGRTVEITNEHEAMSGTPYAAGEFSITVAYMTEAQSQELLRKHSRNGPDVAGFMRAAVQRRVKDWRGISFGAGDVPCTDENKNLLVNGAFEFVDLLLKAARQEFERTAVVAAEEEQKN